MGWFWPKEQKATMFSWGWKATARSADVQHSSEYTATWSPAQQISQFNLHLDFSLYSYLSDSPESPNLSQSSTHTPVHLHCLKRWSFRREWMCCWFAPCSLWHLCISSLQDWKTSVSFYLIFAFIWVLPYNYRYYQQMHWFVCFLKSQHGSKIGSNYS